MWRCVDAGSSQGVDDLWCSTDGPGIAGAVQPTARVALHLSYDSKGRRNACLPQELGELEKILQEVPIAPVAPLATHLPFVPSHCGSSAASSPPASPLRFAPPIAVSANGRGSASGNASTAAKARSAPRCPDAARRRTRRLKCLPTQRAGPKPRTSSPTFKPPSPRPTVRSPPSSRRRGDSSFEHLANDRT